MPKKSAAHLKHQFLRHWREQLLSTKSVLVAVSGGVDSVVLLDLLLEWQPMLGYELAVAHVHHGKLKSTQGVYRDKALKVTRELANAKGLRFFTNAEMPKKNLKSEDDFRKFRRGQLGKIAKRLGAKIATAHSADDVMETRLLRLIRGTGPLGLQALKYEDGVWIHPLLFATKAEIVAWAKSKKLKFVKDPSNASSDPLRNWLRLKWLPVLAKREPSASKNMAKSLQLIAQALGSQSETNVAYIGAEGLDRRRFLELPLVERRQQLALYFRRSGLFGYTQGHIDEVLKRLDTSQNELKFTLLGREWEISRDWIRALQG